MKHSDAYKHMESKLRGIRSDLAKMRTPTLEQLDRELGQLSSTNCWWVTFEARKVLATMIEVELKTQKRRARAERMMR